jgi:membrane-bound serine protease (ClpP class)
LCLGLLWPAGSALSAEVVVLNLTGVINPSAASYVQRGIRQAEDKKAECVVIMLDTPGGMMVSMDEIVKAILNSKVPVVVYVSPKGARAASAGVFIALSADIVAMAPGTSVGAAHPVDLQGKMASEKQVNAASASIKAIAERRNRNPQWAESAVRKSIAVTDQEALSLKVADLVAENLNDLLDQLQSREVVVEKTPRKLSTKVANLIQVEMSQRERFLQILGDPTVAYVLFTLGLLGVIYEFSAPGFGFPGVVGAICMILALYALNAITVSIAGLILMIIAVIMFIMEIKIPSHGALTIGGVIAFALGSLMLFSPHVPTFRLSLQLVVLMTVLMAGFFTFVVAKGLLAQKKAVVSGREALVGMMGEARTKVGQFDGLVFAAGEEWSACTDGEAIPKGTRVKIMGSEGNRVRVVKA